MKFTVPQFIEHEAKIVGPFTFKQFIYVGIAGAISFIIFYSKLHILLKLFLIFSIGGGAMALAFYKVNGIALPSMILSFLKFNVSPKIYIWKMKKGTITMLEQKKPKKEEIKEDETPLKIANKSKLKNLQTEIETKTNNHA